MQNAIVIMRGRNCDVIGHKEMKNSSILIKIRISIAIIGILLHSQKIEAQSDSTSTFKQIAFPSALMVTGLVLNKESTKQNIQEDIRSSFPNFDNRLDDYLMLAPTALDLIFTLSDKKPNDKKHISDIIIGEVAMYITTKSLKKIIGSRRPNGGGQAFPSGHTSQAFTGATLFFHHYKDENVWLASSGYLLASATGSFRVLNNRHWVSDVFFGAGLGILVGNLTYYFNPIGNENLDYNLQMNVSGSGLALRLKF